MCKVFLSSTKSQWDKHKGSAHLGQCLLCEAVLHDLREMRKHHRSAWNTGENRFSALSVKQASGFLKITHVIVKESGLRKEK